MKLQRIVGFVLLGTLLAFGVFLALKPPAPLAPALEAEEAGPRPLRVGFSQAENNNPWRIAETNSIKEEAAARNYELIYTDAQSSTDKQLADVSSILAQNVDYLILAPRQYEGLAPALKRAKEAGVPVILIDRMARGIPGVDYVTYIAADHYWEGVEAAKWLVQQIGGKGNIVEISATSGSSVQSARSRGFRSVIDNYPDIKIIASESGESARATGQKVMETIIQSKGKELTAVYSQADESTIGVIQAMKAAGLQPNQDIAIVSIDGEKDALKAILAGELGATIECNPYLGTLAFDTIDQHRRDEEVPTRIVQPGRIFNIDNAGSYIDQAY